MEISVYIATSLDGFIARKDGSLDWLPGSDGSDDGSGEDYGYGEFMAGIDVLIMGRNTFEMVRSFGTWPYGELRVAVLSSTLGSLPEELPDNVVRMSGLPRDIREMLAADGCRHAYLDGGKTIQAFLDARLVDRLILTRVPVLLGEGIPLFGPLAGDLKLQHIKTLSFENGFVQSHYHCL